MMDIEVLKKLATSNPGIVTREFRGWLEVDTPMNVVAAMCAYIRNRCISGEHPLLCVTRQTLELVGEKEWLIQTLDADEVILNKDKAELGLVGELFAVPVVGFEPQVAGRPMNGFNFYTYMIRQGVRQ